MEPQVSEGFRPYVHVFPLGEVVTVVDTFLVTYRFRALSGPPKIRNLIHAAKYLRVPAGSRNNSENETRKVNDLCKVHVVKTFKLYKIDIEIYARVY